MDTIKCIKTRRSVRLFLEKPVGEKTISELIECALAAPSSRDSQPWEFVVVKDMETREKLSKLKDENNQQHIMTAPVCIVVCVDREKSPTRFAEDGAVASQNILLAAHALGLGAVYVTGFNPKDETVEDGMRKILSLPKNIVPVSIIPVGYANPAEKLDKKNLRKPQDAVHTGIW